MAQRRLLPSCGAQGWRDPRFSADTLSVTVDQSPAADHRHGALPGQV